MSNEQALAVEDWHRLNGLLKEALDLDEPARSRWLAALPAGAQDLKPMLERLLSTVAPGATSQTLPPVVQMAAAAIATMRREQAGDRIGPWQLDRLLAEGGMGTVWIAQRADGVMQRTAALKLPRAEWIDHGLAERIARERAILARLQHQHIAVLYDAGVGADGRPYLALEYIDGEPIDAWCQGRDPREIVRLFVQVVRAVAYAHSQLVIHRDIKPGNVLVTAGGVPKLLDFGISKLLEADAPTAHETALTRLTGRALTLAYAAPEQVLGQPVAVMADVYALGVVLFELLAQTRLYRAQEPRALEAELLEGDPRAPSAVTPDRTRAKLLRGDLDAIVLTALKLAPAERYQSAAAFADDLARYLAGEPVRARPDSRAYRLRKFVARNRLPVAAAGAILLTLAAGLGVALWQADAAREQLRRATAMNDFVLSLIRQADPLASRQMKEADLALLATIEERVDTEFKGAPDQQLQLRVTVGDAYRNRGEMVAARRVFQRAIDAAAPYLPADDLMLLTAQVRASDFHLIVSTAAAEQLDRAIETLRRKGPSGVELLIDALLIRHDLAHNYGIPAYLQPQQRLDALREANELALRTFGEGSRQQLRVVWPLAGLVWALEGPEEGLQVLDSALAQARLRADGASGSVEYLMAQARRAGEQCNDEQQRAEGRVVVERSIAAVHAAYGPTSALLEELLAAQAGCDDAAGQAGPAAAFAIAASRERPPSTALLTRALAAFNWAIGSRDWAESERFYRHVLDNMDAIPEPALRDRLTIGARTGRVCQLAQRGDAAEAERVAASLKIEFDADFARIGRLTPAQGAFWLCLSDAQRQQEHYEQARVSTQGFVERCRASGFGPGMNCTARALSALALVHLDAGQLDEAQAVIEQRLAISGTADNEPRFPLAYGRILIATGRAAAAIEPLRKSYESWLSSNPDKPYAAESLFWLGHAYLAIGDSRGKAMVAQARKTLAASPLKTHQRLAAADKPL
jgi:tetratricopeptide (TPR) repeat protein/tRNA A-37 threonylcarbamoyl transferase component Bud32